MMNNEKKRECDRLIDSYEVLLAKEQEARTNGDERHLRHCLQAQKKVRVELHKRLPV